MRKLKSAGLLIVTLCSSIFAPTNAQSSTPKIGDAAPSLRLEKLLQAPANTDADLSKLRGSVVVLEFWATWCAPCIPAVKHLNELATEFQDKPVQFIAVTDEDEAKVAQFTKDYPVRGWIGIDANRATFEAYQAIGIPHTVIVNRTGQIAAITKAEHVTAAALNDLLADKQIALPFKGAVAANLEWNKAGAPDGIEPLMQVIIKPSNATTSGYKNMPGRFTGDGVPLLAAVVAAYQTSPYRIVNNLPKSTEKYKISIVVPKGRENTLHPLFQQALTATFGINVRREMREEDVFVLSVPKGKTLSLRPSQATEELAEVLRGQIRSKKQRIKTLVDHLEMILSRPVIDRTGLTSEYDWELPYNYADTSVLLDAVRERLGLELTQAKQPMEMLIVEKPGSGSAK